MISQNKFHYGKTLEENLKKKLNTIKIQDTLLNGLTKRIKYEKTRDADFQSKGGRNHQTAAGSRLYYFLTSNE